MTRNRLTGGSSGSQGDDSGTMRPGESRTIHVNRDGLNRTWTVHRTTRDYVYDLCDAYNAENKHDDAKWFVTEAGELRIGFPQAFTDDLTRKLAAQRERERQIWLANHRRKQAENSTPEGI